MLIKAFTKDLSPTRLPPHGRGSQTYIEILAISKLSMELHFLKPSDIFVDQECSQVPRKHWPVIFRDLVFQLMTSSGKMTENLILEPRKWCTCPTSAWRASRSRRRRSAAWWRRCRHSSSSPRRSLPITASRQVKNLLSWKEPCQGPDPKLGSRW